MLRFRDFIPRGPSRKMPSVPKALWGLLPPHGEGELFASLLQAPELGAGFGGLASCFLESVQELDLLFLLLIDAPDELLQVQVLDVQAAHQIVVGAGRDELPALFLGPGLEILVGGAGDGESEAFFLLVDLL